jgi:peptidoglycan/LPS O-acetylase OafA/YrhL
VEGRGSPGSGPLVGGSVPWPELTAGTQHYRRAAIPVPAVVEPPPPSPAIVVQPMVASTTSTGPPRVSWHAPALDGLRGLAVLMVMLHHSTRSIGDPSLDQVIAFWAGALPTGVDLFFVLSGFLITGILYDAKQSKRYFRNFYVRRILRIFPVYYAFLLFFFIILPPLTFFEDRIDGSPAPGNELWYWLYLSNVSIVVHGWQHLFADVSWSLSIEEQFYALWPFVVFRLSRRRLMLVCVAIMAAAIACRAALLEVGNLDAATLLIVSHPDGLAVGAFVALANRAEHGGNDLLRWAPAVGIVSGVSLLVMAIRHDGFSIVNYHSMALLSPTLFAVLYGGILVHALQSSPRMTSVGVLEHPLLTTLGKYSYAMYLFQIPVQRLIESRLVGLPRLPAVPGSSLAGTVVFPSLLDQLLFHMTCVAVTLCVAWLIWQLYERHFLRLKKFYA